MMPDNSIDSRLNSASDELRTQLGEVPVPDFEPRPRVAAPVAAVVALLVAIGAIAFTQFRTETSEVEFLDDTEQTEQDSDTPEPVDQPGLETVESFVQDTRTFTGPGRNSDALATTSADISAKVGMNADQPSTSHTRPELGQQVNDPAYETVVTRITDAGGRFGRVDTNRRQLVNASGTHFIAHVDDGDIEYTSVIELATLNSTAYLEIDEESEPEWHPTNPDLFRHLSGSEASNGSLKLFETNITTNETVVLADLTARVQEVLPTATHMLTRDGRASRNGEHWAWVVRDANEVALGIVSYNLSTDVVTAVLADFDPSDDQQIDDEQILDGIASNGGVGDWYGISTSIDGRYVVLEYENVTIIHDGAFNGYRAINNQGNAGDLVANASGGDSYVYIDFGDGSNNAGWIMSVDLDTFGRTRLIDIYDNALTSLSISGAATDAPGWAVVSTHNCGSDEAIKPWTCNKVMLVEIGGEQQIVSLAHTYGCSEIWLAQPIANANADLSRVFFNSDNGSCGEDAEIYEIEVPDSVRQILGDS